MNKAVLLLLGMFFCSHLLAQKPILNDNAIENWQQLESYQISNDGKFVAYSIKTPKPDSGVFKIISIDKKFNIDLPRTGEVRFTENCDYAAFVNEYSVLCLLNLKNKKIECIDTIREFKTKDVNNISWLIYRKSGENGDLVLHNTSDNTSKYIKDVVDFKVKGDDQLLIQIRSSNTLAGDSLFNFSFTKKTYELLWTSSLNEIPMKISNIIIDDRGSNIAFIGTNEGNSSILFQNCRNKRTVVLYNRQSDIDSTYKLSLIDRFDRLGKGLFISFLKTGTPVDDSLGNDIVRIWKHTDKAIISDKTFRRTWTCRAYLSIELKKILFLNFEHENLNIDRHMSGVDSVFIVSKFGEGRVSEKNWNKYSEIKYKLVFTQSGKVRWLNYPNIIISGNSLNISPNGRYLIFHDNKSDNFFSHDLITNKIRNLTSGTGTSWFVKDERAMREYRTPYLIGGFADNGNEVIIYDEFDIWLVDLSAKRKPINVTNSFGRKNRIELRLIENLNDKPSQSLDKLLLIAYNTITKENGFFKTGDNKNKDPEMLSMGSYIYYAPNIQVQYKGDPPLKAKFNNIFLVERMSAKESKNLFITRNFKEFEKISDLGFEKGYNWLTSELHSWKTLDGNNIQGALFKPENFDSTKRYPVIIYCYEKLSDLLNASIIPVYADGDLSIPWFVSRGYLVLTPDIYYQYGEPGSGLNAENSIVSAAKYISTLSYVNPKKIGLQGHSFGGFETNYVIGKSNLFAAAVSCSGVSNLINRYLDTHNGSGMSMQGDVELGQYRLGTDLWSNPNLYINNSPLFFANRVKTPLMIMNGSDDTGVKFYQALQFFMALRRLGRPVWLLEYLNQGHGLVGASSIDFTRRMTEFFDYYLKDYPAPKWMEVVKHSLIKEVIQ